MFFSGLFWIISLKKFLLCFDDTDACSEDNLADFSDKYVIYPFINEKFVFSFLQNVKDNASITLVFGKSTDFLQTIDHPISTSVNELHFYTNYENIQVSIYLQPIQQFTKLNITKLILDINQIFYLPTGSMVYFFNEGSLLNGQNVIFEPTMEQSIIFHDFEKYTEIGMMEYVRLNIRIDAKEILTIKNNSIVISKEFTSYFGKKINFKSLNFHIYLNKQNPHLTINIEHEDNIQSFDISYATFYFYYIAEEREIETPNCSVTIDTHSDFSETIQPEIPVFYFMKMSSNINIITNKKTESIGIAFADSNQRVYYAYPIIATIMLFFDNMTEDISNCNNLYIYCYQVEDNSENLGHIFSNIRSTDYMYIYFSEPLTLDIESLLHFSRYSISIIGENSDKSYILLTNNQKLVLSINLINSTLEFLDDTAYLESDPYIENGKIIDMEKLIIQNKNCDLTELSLCLGTHYEEINIITIVTSNIDIVLNNDGMIVNGIPVMAGEENLNSEKLNILFMFVSLGEYNLTFQMDPNSYKSHPVTFQILTYHKMNVYFDINSFDRDLMTPVELNFTYFSQDYISFFVHEVPERNVILKVFSPSNDNSFFDMSPISVSQMGICFPQMICIPNQVDDYLYFSYGGDLDLVKNRINNSKESENFQKLTITYPYLYADIPYLYKTVYDDLDLDKFDRNLEFVGDPHIILPQVEIETEKDFNGKRLTVDNIVLVINKHWILPELIMNNDGIIKSNGTTAQYAEVDSSNIDKVRRIYFDTLLVRTPLIDGEILNILFETNRITINNRSIPLFTNFTLKFLFTQDVIKSEHLNVYLDTISESAVKSATFIFANVRTKVDVYFSNEFPKISNSPFFLFISENHLEVEIKNVNQPIRYRYENSNGEIYEEFPINNHEEIYICYSNQSIFYDDCYNLSQTISYYFKKIDDDYELHHLLQSKVSKTFKELHLYLFSPIDITLNFRDLDLIPNQLFIIGNETIEEEENQSKISIFLPENRKFELLKANNVFITVENATLQSDSIDLYHCTLEARVNVSQFNCTIFDVSSLKGRINTLNLNYTFSNSQWKNIKKTGLNVSNNINSSQKIIQFSENSLNIDSNQVYLSDISVQKTFYELFFTESETIYFDFSEISKETNYNFIITFKEFDEEDELYNQKKSLVIRFTNSWKNFNYQSQSKILIKIDRNSLNEHFLKLHSIIYYSEEIPSFMVLTVVNGSDLIYPPETERKSNKQDNISVAVIGCSVVCIITILCGVIFLCKYKSNLKKDHENLFMLIDHWVRK